MASIIKVDDVQDAAGNNIINESGDTITIGASGDTITVPSGATVNVAGTATGQNYPAFQAHMNSDQGSISADTYTKVVFDTEFYDTGSMFDTSLYRFTPTVAGKYFCYYTLGNSFSSGTPDDVRSRFYFNGSAAADLRSAQFREYNGAGLAVVVTTHSNAVLTFNGSSDYVEVYGRGDGTPQFSADSYFGAYRIGA